MEYEHRNHNQLAPRVYADLQQMGFPQPSRNGPVLRMPGVTTLFALCPRERVNFCSARDANPFFHVVEAVAMLAAHNDVGLMAYLAKNMRNFSDDGERFNAFYGTRLRETWGDQLAQIIDELAKKPDSRQAVAQIWDPRDLTKETKDKACNLCLMFQRGRSGDLEMTSINRSNDAVWGIFGANTVHLSFFQEYVACALGWPVGSWTHVSNNLHVYTGNPQWAVVKDAPVTDYYAPPALIPTGPLLFDEPGLLVQFHHELRCYVAGCQHAMRTGNINILESLNRKCETAFIRDVAVPMFIAWHLRKQGDGEELVWDWLHRIKAPDWHLACTTWVRRRAGKAVAS